MCGWITSRIYFEKTCLNTTTLGRQVNFYMADDDETNFVKSVKETGNVEIFPNVFASDRVEPVQVLPNKVSATLTGKRFFLFNHNVSSRLFSIRNKDGSAYSFDWTRSSAIEFQRCFVQDGIMYPGRIFADSVAYDLQLKSSLPKEAEFGRWYESLAAWIRKYYRPIRLYDPGRTKVPSWTLYVGPAAETFHRNGGKFSVNPSGARMLILVDLEGKTTTLKRPEE